jgi:hypothetical protein
MKDVKEQKEEKKQTRPVFVVPKIKSQEIAVQKAMGSCDPDTLGSDPDYCTFES